MTVNARIEKGRIGVDGQTQRLPRFLIIIWKYAVDVLNENVLRREFEWMKNTLDIYYTVGLVEQAIISIFEPKY